MSVTSELRASARATYRALFRAAASTFKGDDRVLTAFRKKVRDEFREGRSQADANAYSARIQLGREVADVLRRNIVQGMKVNSPSNVSAAETSMESTVQDERGVWRLRITEHTELGSNETIKSSTSPSQSQKAGRRQTSCQSTASAAFYSTSSSSRVKDELEPGTEIYEETSDDLAPVPSSSDASPAPPPPESLPSSNSPRKLNFPALKRAHQGRVKPELNESDLEESFVRGSGPGGQSINKTQNNVQLLHKPTSIRVSCQETRSLQQNRLIARKILLDRLDQIANPGFSKEDMKRAKQVERERRRRKKAKRKARTRLGNSEDE